jgi:hypothetical protein
MLGKKTTASLSVAVLGMAIMSAATTARAGNDEVRLRANLDLSGQEVLSGSCDFRSRTKDGIPTRKFSAEAEGYAVGDKLLITVGKITLDEIITVVSVDGVPLGEIERDDNVEQDGIPDTTLPVPSFMTSDFFEEEKTCTIRKIGDLGGASTISGVFLDD